MLVLYVRFTMYTLHEARLWSQIDKTQSQAHEPYEQRLQITITNHVKCK